ncbi:asparagine synthase (glutamine-hydrolyzing) [Leptolyngbya sp. 15MV]|nr:asparagine synthase (glutamine-hydrolyzing) [Leptolyngbya sp. 15MV]
MLAIIGLGETGAQPMADPSRRFHLIFNGEIYNHVELRAGLAARGERFAGDSDTEVMLRAIALDGLEATLPRLRGMFAFLLWDDHAKRLHAVRDRYGIKPLYFAEGTGGIAFGSEIKQVLGLPGIAPRMNLARVHDFLAWGIADHTDETLFATVKQLRGGEMLTVDAGDAALRPAIRRWYPVRDGSQRLHLGEAEAAERFRALFDEAMRLHLRADVPVGSCLSGGLDSSSIVCTMAGLLGPGADLHSFSAVFAEKRVDERRFMEAVVAKTGATPHWVSPRPEDVFRLAGDITWHQDEPFGSTSIYAQWCVFAAAREAGITVMLDGQGADEQLGGYHHGFGWHLAGLAGRLRFAELARTIAARARQGASVPNQLARLGVALLPHGLATGLRARRAQAPFLASGAFAAMRDAPSPQDLAIAQLGLPPVTDIGSWCLAMTHASNLPMLLHWEDRSSMAHGVEARVPFVDHELVEFSLALWSDHKFLRDETKVVLRRAMAGVLPEQVANRRDKLGFATPEAEWIRGPLGRLAEAGVEATIARMVALLSSAVAALLFAGIASLGGAEVTQAFAAIPALGIAGGLRLDGLSFVFALLITGIGALIFLYAHAYLAGDPRLRRLMLILMLFMVSMLGAVLADDVILLFVFWELTSLTSFFLVGYDHEKPGARRAALQALLVTAGGGLALLAGLILAAIAAGTTSLSGLIAAKDAVLAHPLAIPAMLLIIAGCFAKSAQVPFHFWLPNAMAAPTPVSAYLHSATMVKLGVYLLARMNPVYQDVALWHSVLIVFGTATAVTGALLAFRETDLKRVLAYTTVAALGTLVMLIGIAPGLSITAAVTFLIVHALYKAALFMVAGIVDHETETRDASALGGLGTAMPWTAATAVLAALSMAGLPPFVGFVAKELIYEAKLELGAAAEVLLFAGFLVNAATVAIAAVLSWRLFFGPRRPTAASPHDPPWAMRLGPIMLASLGLLAGAVPSAIGTLLVDPAATAILGRPADVELKLWHGFNLVLALSVATIAVGVAIHLAWERIVPRFRAIHPIDRFGPSAGYAKALAGIVRLAETSTRLIQHGSLSGYIVAKLFQ